MCVCQKTKCISYSTKIRTGTVDQYFFLIHTPSIFEISLLYIRQRRNSNIFNDNNQSVCIVFYLFDITPIFYSNKRKHCHYWQLRLWCFWLFLWLTRCLHKQASSYYTSRFSSSLNDSTREYWARCKLHGRYITNACFKIIFWIDLFLNKCVETMFCTADTR